MVRDAINRHSVSTLNLQYVDSTRKPSGPVLNSARDCEMAASLARAEASRDIARRRGPLALDQAPHESIVPESLKLLFLDPRPGF